MAKYNRIEVFLKMKEQGMIPVFYNEDFDLSLKVLKACYRGGGRLLEFTNRDDYAHEVFKELNRYCIKEMPEMMLGAGTIVDAGTAGLYIQYGANFVVTPSLREDVARTCNRRKILWSAGCGSVTEMSAAEELGCELVKLFPGGTYGPGMVKGIKAPHPWTNIMPTGGVAPTEENLRAWFDAGVTCVGMGSKMISKDILANGDFDKLEHRVRDTLALIKRIRGEH